MVSLSTCNLGILPWMTILLNVYGTVLFDIAVAIDKHCTIHLNVDVSARVRECVRVCVIHSSISRVTTIFPFTISCSIQ